jgi:hypothetical protein
MADSPACRKCGHVSTVCPRCGHSWAKHDSRLFYNCSGQKEGGNQYENCGCEMTQEQAERAHQKKCFSRSP